MINMYWQTKFSKALSSWLNRRASLREHSGENQLQRVLETERKTELCFSHDACQTCGRDPFKWGVRQLADGELRRRPQPDMSV